MYTLQSVNPFDVVAEWIRHLRDVDGNLFYQTTDVRNTLKRFDDLDETVNTLFQQLPVINDGTRLVRWGVPIQEKRMVENWEYYNNFFAMLEVLSRFTEKLRCEEILSSGLFRSISHDEQGVVKEFSCLNSNAVETGFQIIPLVNTINDSLEPSQETEAISTPSEWSANGDEKKHWAADRLPGVQGDLTNIYYIEQEKLACNNRLYTVRHSVLQRHFYPEGKQKLKIAICPLVCGDQLNVRRYSEEIDGQTHRLCCIDGLKDPELVHNKIRAALLAAGEEHADIAICSEIMGDQYTTSDEFFSEIKQQLSERALAMPEMVLLPTWWHDYRNELFVKNAGGALLCIQQKQFQYVDEKQQYAEDLRNPEPVIHVVHIPGVGRFSFPICRDFLDVQYIQLMLQVLRVTFLLCPSYSPHKTQFDLTSSGTEQYGCYSIWCNTCAAIRDEPVPPKFIGIADGPKEAAKPKTLLEPDCKGDCGGKDSPCVFLVEIEMNRSANISYRHINSRQT